MISVEERESVCVCVLERETDSEIYRERDGETERQRERGGFNYYGVTERNYRKRRRTNKRGKWLYKIQEVDNTNQFSAG